MPSRSRAARRRWRPTVSLTGAPGGQAPRRRTQERRAEILEAAADLFLRDGYHRTSMGDIAAVVGITPPALYRHFAGKQQLLGQVLIGSVEVTVDRLRAVHDQGGTVRDLLDGLFTVAADRRGLLAL